MRPLIRAAAVPGSTQFDDVRSLSSVLGSEPHADPGVDTAVVGEQGQGRRPGRRTACIRSSQAEATGRTRGRGLAGRVVVATLVARATSTSTPRASPPDPRRQRC